MAQAMGKEAPPQGPPPQYPIESVDNALRLLLLFTEQPRIRLTDASKYLGVASSTAHRLLAMLQYRGFVRQDGASKAYEPGPALTRLASLSARRLDIRTLVHPALERLRAEFDETVHFGRLEGQQVFFLDSVESDRPLRVSSRMGRYLPAHCTSTGKAILSTLTINELRALYPAQDLEAVTDRSLASRDALERDLEATRRRGHAVSRQESEEGVVSMAAPVIGPSGGRYAITVSLPTQRMSPALGARLARALTVAAEELAPLLG
jgi:IclR family acetate operon transcriptional repressor